MWQLEEHRCVDQQCAASPQEILQCHEKWKDIALISGLPGLRQITGFHDEALAGQWHGYRSPRLGLQYRVIYRALAAKLVFQVASVTAHDWRK